MPWSMCEDHVSPTVWVTGRELRSSALVAGAFPLSGPDCSFNAELLVGSTFYPLSNQ